MAGKQKSDPTKNKGSQREGRKGGAAKGGVKGKSSQEEMKKRRNRPGTVALREIKKYQKFEDKRVCAKAPLVRRIRETLTSYDPDIRISSVSLDMIHEASEAYLTNVLEDAHLCAIHGKRQTLYRKDVSLALRIRGDAHKRF